MQKKNMTIGIAACGVAITLFAIGIIAKPISATITTAKPIETDIQRSVRQASEARQSVPDASREFARFRAKGIAYADLCGDLNYSYRGDKLFQDAYSEAISMADPNQMALMITQYTKRFSGMNRSLSPEARAQECDKAWAEYGDSGTVAPRFLRR